MAKNRKKVSGGGSGDVSNQQLLDEILLRQEGDSYLQKQVDDLKAGGTGSGDVEVERQQRIAADQAIQDQIAALSTSISDTETTVSGLTGQVQNISQESIELGQRVDASSNTVTQLSLDLQTETQARILKDNELQSQIEAIIQNSPDTGALTQLITDEKNARIGADTSLQNQISNQNLTISGINSTVTSHSTQISDISDLSQQNANQLNTVGLQATSALEQVAESREAIIELQDAFENLPIDADPILDCTSDVQPDMLVYIDIDGKAKPALASSPQTMPAQFYVKDKPSADTCTVTKEILKSVPGDTNAGKTFFVSESVPGAVQITVPAGPGKVLQPVGVGLSGSKRHYSITDRITVRS